MGETARDDVDTVRLQVGNFGPIAEADVELRPLTLFFGPSNSGKSYLAMLLYALQRLPDLRRFQREFPFRRISRNGQGPGSSDAWKEMLSWAREVSAPKRGAGLAEVPLPSGVAKRVRSALRDTDRLSGLAEDEISRCFGVDGTGRLIRHSGGRSAEIVLQRFSAAGRVPGAPFQHSFSLVRGQPVGVSATVPDAASLYVDQRALRRSRNRLSWMLEELESLQSETQTAKRRQMSTIVWELAEAVFPYAFGRVWNSPYYLPADRTGVMHAHQVVVSALIGRSAHAALSPESPDSPLPTLSGVLADFIRQLIMLQRSPVFTRTSRPRARKLSEKDFARLSRHRAVRQADPDLATRLEEEVLTGAVRAESLPGLSYPEFFYRPTGWSEDLPLTRSSSMVSELAPVVLYLRYVIRVGDTLIIEEPEAHLHPEKQVQFVQLLARAVRAGIRVVMTTHSEWVLEEVTNLVRASKLPAAQQKAVNGAGVTLEESQVGAWLFEPKRRPKGSVIREIPLTSESGTDAAGYDDVATEQHNRWAAIANQSEVGVRP